MRSQVTTCSWLIEVLLLGVLLQAGCKKSSESITIAPPQRAEPTARNDTPPPSPEAAPVETDVDEPAPEVVSREPDAPPVVDGSTGWLIVERLEAGVDGGWASGDFLPERNKIEVRTRGVAQFAMDLSEVRVDWSRKVVIGINGRNAELRKRDFDIYHIGQDDHGTWTVLEP